MTTDAMGATLRALLCALATSCASPSTPAPVPPVPASISRPAESTALDQGPGEDAMEAAPVSEEDAEETEDTAGEPIQLNPRSKPIKQSEAAGHEQSLLGARQFVAQPAAAAKLRIHFIDIGQGDATLIACPNGAKVLVDFGSHTGGEKGAKRYLHKVLEGDKVDDLVITHPDGDHYNQVHFGLEGVGVDQVWTVGDWSDYNGPGNRSAKAWLQSMEQQGKLERLDENGPYHDEATPHPGFNCGDAKIWVVAAGVTGENAGWRKNTMSIVLLVSYGNFDAMLTGDATTETEEQMIQWHCPAGWEAGDGCWLQSEVLKLGHHGSKWTSTGKRWAAAVSPEVAVASATRHKKHGHPSKEAVERVHATTRDHSGHKFLWWHDSNTPEHLDNYGETVYSTAVNRHIYVEVDATGGYVVWP